MFQPRRIALAGALATFALLAAASSSASTLQGRVLDPQDKAVPGARVRAENEATSLAREATTDSSGAFTLPELPPGAYTLVAEAQGFAPRTQKGLRLAVGQTLRHDVALAVSGVSESVVTVAVAPDLVSSGTSTVDGVIGADGHRAAAPERPQLPRARLPRTRQRPHPELRPHEDEQRGGGLRRADRAAEA